MHSVAMISRMSSAGRCSKKPGATSFDTPMAVPAIASCMHQVEPEPRREPAWSIPACGMSSKYDAQSANVRTNWNASATTSIAVDLAVAHRDRDLHERLAAHDDRERAQALDQVVLVERRERRRSDGAPRRAARSSPPCPTAAADRSAPDSGQRPTPTTNTRRRPRAATARCRGERRVRGRAQVCGAPVHDRDGADERGVGAPSSYHLVVTTPACASIATSDHEEHLQQHQQPVVDVGHAEPVREHRGGEPDPPHRRRTPRPPTRCARRRAGATPRS